jgi:predicted SnoaL-like aldol condensation-catalyzing enzyme
MKNSLWNLGKISLACATVALTVSATPANAGLAGFGAVLKALPQGSAKVNTVRVLREGDYVFAHTEYNFFGPKIGFDIFRFENGKIAEHWDTIEAIPAKVQWKNSNGKF